MLLPNCLARTDDLQRGSRPSHTRPNCTHVVMEMTYNAARCDICARFPALGWLYECKQDHDQEVSVKCKPKLLHRHPSDSPLVIELKTLGFSESIIKQAVSGQYTEAQLEVLKAQNAKVTSVIKKQISPTAGSVESKESNDSESPHPNITIRKHRLSNSNRGQVATYSPSVAKCALKCCHVRHLCTTIQLRSCQANILQACRPYYRDRVFGRLNSIFLDGNTDWAHHDLANAPIHDASLVRQIGLRKPAKPLQVVSTSELDNESSTSSSGSSSSNADAPELHSRNNSNSLGNHSDSTNERSPRPNWVSDSQTGISRILCVPRILISSIAGTENASFA
jgi:hypothetical protein